MTQELKAARVQQTTPSERHIREDWPAEFFGPVDNNVAVAVTGHTVTPAAERLAADLVDISRSVDLCDGLLTSHPEPVLSGLEEVLRQRAAVLVPWGNEGEDGLVLVGSPMPELLARLAKRLGPGYSVQAHCSGGAYRAWQATGFQDG